MNQRTAAVARTPAPYRHAVLAAAASLLAGGALWLGAGASTPVPQAGGAVPARPAEGLRALPLPARGPVSSALGAADPAFAVRSGAGGELRSTSAHAGLRAVYGRDGVSFAAHGVRERIALTSIARDGAWAPVARVLPTASANRAVYARAGVTEWYANGPLGVEQGFVLRRPSASGAPQAATLTLRLALSGSLAARAARDGVDLVKDGRVLLRYGGLAAVDARGRSLPARLLLHGGTLDISVDARGAAYPLRVDPIISGERLAGGAEETPGGFFGRSVAVSTDGTTALVGAPRDGEYAGAAFVFKRSGSTWVQQGRKLLPTGEEGKGYFGQSVALSADGNTAIVTANADAIGIGAAWVFTRSGSTWTQQGSKLTGAGESGKGHFGDSVALSGDGNTAIVVGSEDAAETGAAWIFVRNEGTWTQQGAKIAGASGASNFNDGVALSADGRLALIGSPRDNGGGGAVRVFARSGETWTQQGPPLAPSDEIGAGSFGESIALTPDGSTALIGGYTDAEGAGAAWLFTRAATTWTQHGTKIAAGGAHGLFGASVAISADGSVADVGAPRSHGKQGAVWTFARYEGELVGTGARLVGAEEPSGPEEPLEEVEPGSFGRSVAITGDGTMTLVGAPRDGENNGSVWSFLQAAPIATTGGATVTSKSSATITGSVDPRGAALSDCHFEYGLATSAGYEASVPCSPSPRPEAKPIRVTAALSGLAPSSVYRYRLLATSSGGSSQGAAMTFATPGESASGAPGGETTGGGSHEAATGAAGFTGGGVLGFVSSGGGASAAAGRAAGSTAAGCSVGLASRVASAPGGVGVAIKLRAAGGYAGACTGTLRVTVTSRHAGKLARTTIAAGSFSISAGPARVVRLRLNARGRALLAAGHGRLRASLAIVKRAPAPTQAQTVALVITRRTLTARH